MVVVAQTVGRLGEGQLFITERAPTRQLSCVLLLSFLFLLTASYHQTSQQRPLQHKTRQNFTPQAGRKKEEREPQHSRETRPTLTNPDWRNNRDRGGCQRHVEPWRKRPLVFVHYAATGQGPLVLLFVFAPVGTNPVFFLVFWFFGFFFSCLCR